MKEYFTVEDIFSADKRNQSNQGMNLASHITIEDLIKTGKKAEENKIINHIKATKLQTDIIKYLYEDHLKE